MAPTYPDLTDRDTWTNDPETKPVEGCIVDDRELPPTNEHGWWLWLPGTPA